MADDRSGREAGPRLWEARTEAGMRAAAVVMDPPSAKHLPQVVLTEGDQIIETLPAERPEQPFTIAIRQGGLAWCPEDADTHRGHGCVQPGRVNAVPIVEDEPMAMRFRQDLPELLEGLRGGGMRRNVDVQQTPAPHLERHKDVQDAERRGHHDTEVAGHERLRLARREDGWR
jgi:hypothetical protein